jgi:hypothetical protein
MKSTRNKIFGYSFVFFIILILLNLNYFGNTIEDQGIIKSSSFFDDFKIYYSLSFLIIIIGLLEKSESKKLDDNIIIKFLFCFISLLFGFLGYQFEPRTGASVTYNWLDYFQIIFFGTIWIGLYIQMFVKSKRNN